MMSLLGDGKKMMPPIDFKLVLRLFLKGTVMQII